MRPENRRPQNPPLKQVNAFTESIQDISSRYGMSYFVIGRFPDHAHRTISAGMLTTNWPDAVLDRYKTTDVHSDSPLMTQVRTLAVPVRADRLMHVGPKGGQLSAGQGGSIEEPGFSRSLAFCTYDAARTPYIFLYSSQSFIEDAAIGMLLLESMRCLSTLYPSTMRTRMLTAREIDCLAWAAAGKNSEEIGEVLKVTANTVNGYLQTAYRKLGVANRVQAVAAAVKLGLL